jgi:hypothetical protein
MRNDIDKILYTHTHTRKKHKMKMKKEKKRDTTLLGKRELMMADISQYLRPRRRNRRISWKKKAVLGPPLGWRHAVYQRKNPGRNTHSQEKKGPR